MKTLTISAEVHRSQEDDDISTQRLNLQVRRHQRLVHDFFIRDRLFFLIFFWGGDRNIFTRDKIAP